MILVLMDNYHPSPLFIIVTIILIRMERWISRVLNKGSRETESDTTCETTRVIESGL